MVSLPNSLHEHYGSCKYSICSFLDSDSFCIHVLLETLVFLFLHTSDAVQVCVCRMRSLFHLFPPHFSCLSCLSCFSCLFFFILSSCDSKSFCSQEAFIKDLRFIFNDQSPMIWYCNALDKSPTLERLWIWLSLSFSDKLLMTIS